MNHRRLLMASLPLTLLALPEAFADLPRHSVAPPRVIQSPHEEAMRLRLGAPGEKTLPQVPFYDDTASNGPSKTVYGYWPYWGDPVTTLQYDSLSHLAIFGVTLNSDGSLSNKSYWTNNAPTAISLAAPYGVRVHVTLICFDTSVQSSVFSSSSKRAKAISELTALVNDYGGQGVNIDVEGLQSSQKANFVTFIQELRPYVEDLYLAMPAVDWSGSYDYDVLSNLSDGLFIMGYGYHWSGGDPGPVAPLYGGSPWGSYALDWTVDDYLYYGATRDKLILGLPLYGYDWPTTNTTVPGDATGSASAQVYSVSVPNGEKYGRKWDSTTHTPYAFPDSVSQLWYDDNASLNDKMAYAVNESLQGFGFWALTYEDNNTEFWNIVDGLAGNDTCPDADGDGVTTCGGDCDDADPAVFAGAVESCDGKDNNCDGLVDEAGDADGDGYNACDDCDDSNANTNPSANEIPMDGIDNNCNGEIDETQGNGCTAPSGTAGPKAGMPAGLLLGLLVAGRRLWTRRETRA